MEIKECKVLNYNKHQKIIVVDFSGIQVQFPCLTEPKNTCYVKSDHDVYCTVSENEFSKFINEKKIAKKKTPITNNIETAIEVQNIKE